MLKIQKLSLAALMVSAVVSGSVFAEDKAAPSASDASYAVGALMGNQVKDLVEAQKEVIQYDNARILDGLKDALEGKVDEGSVDVDEYGWRLVNEEFEWGQYEENEFENAFVTKLLQPFWILGLWAIRSGVGPFVREENEDWLYDAVLKR